MERAAAEKLKGRRCIEREHFWNLIGEISWEFSSQGVV